MSVPSTATATMRSPPIPSLLSLFILLSLLSFPVRSQTTHGSSEILLPSERDEDPCSSRSNIAVSCPVHCFRPDPVCGVNGVTYWCGCPDAACSGVRVAKFGFCEVGSGGHGLVSGQALLLVHIVWLIVLGFSVLCGLF